MKKPADDYLEKALKAEARAGAASDPDIKARWLGIAFGYRELARYNSCLVESGLSVGSRRKNTAWQKPSRGKSRSHLRTMS